MSTKRTRKAPESATEAENPFTNPEFLRQMQERQEAEQKEQARVQALQERSLRAQERSAEGLHVLAAALREVGLALVAGGRQTAVTGGVKAVVPKQEAPAASGKPVPPPTKPGPKAPEFGDVRKAIVALAAAKPSDAAFEVLRKFGVEAISDLKPEQYVDVIKAADAAREEK